MVKKTKQKQIDMMNVGSDLLNQIEALDVLIAENEAKLAGLTSVIDGLRAARDRLIDASKQAGLSIEERQALETRTPQKLTTREMVLEMLGGSYPDGYTMAELWRAISDRWSPDIQRATLSTTLIRMRDKDGVGYDGKMWRLKKAPQSKRKR